MNIIKPGTSVKLKNIDYCGIIINSIIGPDSIIYRIAYYENGAYVTRDFYEIEFDVIGNKTNMHIGFNKEAKA